MALRCGATALADRATQELEASGARARKVVPAGIDALTASERRVCQLAADGRTNREIAQALFVTLRTVETHLTAAYRKLDVSARHELRAAFGVDTGDAPARAMRRDRPMENEPHEQESAGVPPVVA